MNQMCSSVERQQGKHEKTKQGDEVELSGGGGVDRDRREQYLYSFWHTDLVMQQSSQLQITEQRL